MREADGMSEAEARSMVQTAEETGLKLGVAYYRRAYPKVQRAKQLLDACAIGKPVLAELTCHEWRMKREVSAVGSFSTSMRWDAMS